MSFTINEVTLMGHLGGDPEIRRTQDGRPVASFSVATSDVWRDKASGERKEKTMWHRIVVFNEHICKIVEQYVKKGSYVYIVGKLVNRKWVDQGGAEKWVTEVVLEAFHGEIGLVGSKRDGVPPNDGSNHDFSREPSSAPRRAVTAGGGRNADMDDDIPF